MSGPSKIEWTEHSWNPVVGCSIVSPGCTNCYAMRQAFRIEAMTAELAHRGRGGAPHYNGTTRKVNGNAVWTGKVALAPKDVLTAPLRRKKPTTYFVNSMGDLFHEAVPDEWIDQVFAVMALAPQHVFQVLTKRAERMRKYLGALDLQARLGATATHVLHPSTSIDQARELRHAIRSLPLPNVWLGVSAEDQRRADERIPHLLATPAAVRFVSAEPLLGPIDFQRIDLPGGYEEVFPLGLPKGREDDCGPQPSLDQIIVGGESGPSARPMHPDWARSIRDQCAAAGVPFFFKQWGAWAPNETASDRMIVAADGDVDIPDERTADEEAGEAEMAHIGKKAAGRLLDGVEHNGMPGRG